MNTESLRASRKSQAPKPREIPIIKFQSKTSPGRSQFWSLRLGTYLGFGIWCLELLFSQNSFAQGPLTPPAGAPAPTMKTLQQVEPRIDLATVAGDANSHHRITLAGSYYLSGDLQVTKVIGISVVAEDVTIDLTGFAIRRTGGTAGSGIVVNGTAHRCKIRNGSIKGSFDNGVQQTGPAARGGSLIEVAVSGCSETGAKVGDGWQVDGVEAHDNSGTGIRAGNGCTLTNCTANANGKSGIIAAEGSTLSSCTAQGNNTASPFGTGIAGGAGSTLTNCTARGNQGNEGIAAGDGSTLSNCSASTNTGVGINVGNNSNLINCTATQNNDLYGIIAGSGGTLIGCTASENHSVLYGIRAGLGSTVRNCTARANDNTSSLSGIYVEAKSSVIGCTATDNIGGDGFLNAGIRIDADSTVKDCTVQGNRGDGIRVTENCQVTGNIANGNGPGTSDGAGIHATGQANRIDGNHVIDNDDRGIDVDDIRNLIIRNTVRTSGNNYVIVAGNRIAQIVVVATNAADISSANSGSTDGFTNVDPWANFSF